jgi:hypothetical protein
MALFAPDFLAQVSGRLGLEIFDVVERWLDQSLADRRIEHHATRWDGDRVLVWYTQQGRRIGNGFPRLSGCPVTGSHVNRAQIHVFRVENARVVEHWAVRDDLGCWSRSAEPTHPPQASINGVRQDSPDNRHGPMGAAA